MARAVFGERTSEISPCSLASVAAEALDKSLPTIDLVGFEFGGCSMIFKTVGVVCVATILYACSAVAQCPYDPRCLNNPYGAGGPSVPDGLNNPYSQYGSPYSNRSTEPVCDGCASDV